MISARVIRVGLALAVVAAVAVVLTTGGDGHSVRATFPSAINLVSGAEVRAGGVKVGTVRSIELRDRTAQVELVIEDDELWPLREGTQASLRLGGTVSYANRYIEIVPGPDNGRALAEDAEIGVRDTTSPVEFDELFNTFDPQTRAGLGELIDNGARTFWPRGEALAGGLGVSGGALAEAAATFDGLSKDPYALRTLLRSGASVAGELARRDAALRRLVDATAQTLTTTAASGGEIRATLQRLPGALRTLRGTLGRTENSLDRVDGLVGDIAPGARELTRIASPLRHAVGTLGDVAPELDATLTRLQRSGPTIARFLSEAVPQVQRLRPVLSRLAPMLACVRAYAPETAGLLSTWAAFNTAYDTSGRYAQLNGQNLPFPNETPLPSSAIAASFPQLRYSLVRPPGLSVGQPEPLPSCGATAELQDAAKDPEARR